MSFDFRVRYWGVTGSFPHPLPPDEVQQRIARAIVLLAQAGALQDLSRRGVTDADVHDVLERFLPQGARAGYGGNTSCIEIQTPETQIILDSGSGFRGLGVELAKRWADPLHQGPREAHVLLTHPHIDHTQATPFFDPYYNSGNRITIWAPKSVLDSLDVVLDPRSAWRSVYFPPTYDIMHGLKEFRHVQAGESFHINDVRIDAYSLHHPGGCLAYRMHRNGKTLVFASDHEHQSAPDKRLAEFSQGADLLYLDAQYRQEEYDGAEGLCGEPPLSRRGWGHSTYHDALRTAVEAQALRIHLGHHDPKRLRRRPGSARTPPGRDADSDAQRSRQTAHLSASHPGARRPHRRALASCSFPFAPYALFRGQFPFR